MKAQATQAPHRSEAPAETGTGSMLEKLAFPSLAAARRGGYLIGRFFAGTAAENTSRAGRHIRCGRWADRAQSSRAAGCYSVSAFAMFNRFSRRRAGISRPGERMGAIPLAAAAATCNDDC